MMQIHLLDDAPEAFRPDLVDADGAEVAEHLRARGWTTPFGVWNEPDGLRVRARGVSPATINAALDAFVPTAAKGEWVAPDPTELLGHVEHVLALTRATDAQLAAMTDAQVRHALRDLARAFVIYVRSDWQER